MLDIGQKPLSFVISYESVRLKKKEVYPFLLFLFYLRYLKNRILCAQSKGSIIEEFSFCIAYATKDLENQEKNRQKCSAY